MMQTTGYAVSVSKPQTSNPSSLGCQGHDPLMAWSYVESYGALVRPQAANGGIFSTLLTAAETHFFCPTRGAGGTAATDSTMGGGGGVSTRSCQTFRGYRSLQHMS